MKINIMILIALLTITHLQAQNSIADVLASIEANSTQLAALREQMEAEYLSNRTDLNPHDPEVEYNYFWGTPSAIGNRTDLVVTQSFDFPTSYWHRKKIADLSNENLRFAYHAKRKNLLLEAQAICINLVYYNALQDEYSVRLEHAQSIAKMYATQFELGSANILEKNKAKLNLINTENTIKAITIEQQSLLSELKALNGGKTISFNAKQNVLTTLPTNFTSWYAEVASHHPLLQAMQKEQAIADHAIKLNTALNLPKLTTGYMSEKMVGEHFRGLTVGVSIPLWENRNKLKQAKAQARYTEKSVEDMEVQVYNQLENLYLKAQHLAINAQQYLEALSDFNNESYLKQALDAGEISLLNYLLELEFYYDTKQKALETNRDYELAVANLMQYANP